MRTIELLTKKEKQVEVNKQECNLKNELTRKYIK